MKLNEFNVSGSMTVCRGIAHFYANLCPCMQMYANEGRGIVSVIGIVMAGRSILLLI